MIGYVLFFFTFAAAMCGPTIQAANAGNRVVWSKVRATIEYDDGSTKEFIGLKGHSTDDSDIRLATRNVVKFLESVVRREALFPCKFLEGPSGRVIVGKDPIQMLGPIDETSPHQASAAKKRRLQVYAAPNVFGPWQIVGSHIGRARYHISVTPIGDTSVTCEVEYYNSENEKVVEGFAGSVSIKTGDSVANVRVRLRGVPTGSSCWVDIEP